MRQQTITVMTLRDAAESEHGLWVERSIVLFTNNIANVCTQLTLCLRYTALLIIQ